MIKNKNNKKDTEISCVALIPARLGSKRLPRKNIKELFGHPLIAYTICPALDSGVYDRVIVSTESDEIRDIALAYGAEVPFMRPAEYAADSSEDIDFVLHALGELGKEGYKPDCFSILRPTNPLRRPDTIQRAWKQFISDPTAHSIRAIEKCVQHPAKMWRIHGSRIRPVEENPNKNDTPWHSMSYQALSPTYAQNASLEIAWSHIPLKQRTIAGTEIMPFVSEGYEGFDINVPEDWYMCEYLINNNLVELPKVSKRESKRK